MHTATQETQAHPAHPPAIVRRLRFALLGYLSFGLSGALGMPSLAFGLRSIPAVFAIALGTAVLTSPSLIVAHQLMGLSASPRDLAEQIAAAVLRLGELALGFSPMLLTYALSSDGAPFLQAALLSGLGLLVLVEAVSQIQKSESSLTKRVEIGVLLGGWALLNLAVGLRLTIYASDFIAQFSF